MTFPAYAEHPNTDPCASSTSLFSDFVKKHLDEPVTVFLTNGVKLEGSITGFDAVSLLLTRNGSTQVIQRHAVATIMPHGG
jgi:host factor-I protein